MPERILILGGTSEAAQLAANLVAEGHDVTTSLAGRTKEPAPLAGKIRRGGFSTAQKNGAQGLADYLTREGFNRLIDASHPFATQISANAAQAAHHTGIRFERHIRPAWESKPGDLWLEVATLDEAVDAIPSGASVLLALGSQHIAPFARRKDVRFMVRMVDAPEEKLPLHTYDLVLGRPPLDAASETILLKTHAITHIVCRNSGGKGAYAKIEAARMLQLPVIIIQRP